VTGPETLRMTGDWFPELTCDPREYENQAKRRLIIMITVFDVDATCVGDVG
jgi:hypothetical protein